MKIRTSIKGSHQVPASKGLLPFMASAAIVTGAGLSLLAQPARALPVEVTYNNTVYTLEVSTCFAPGTIIGGCSGATDFRTSSHLQPTGQE